MNPRQPDIPREAQEAAHRGDVIGAIKILREATGLGLKEAKDAVDGYLTHHPSVEEQFRVAGGRTATGMERRVAVI